MFGGEEEGRENVRVFASRSVGRADYTGRLSAAAGQNQMPHSTFLRSQTPTLRPF